MNRKSMWALVCVCVLIPSMARADDGGWLDWLYRLDTKLWGVNTEFHALCLSSDGDRVPCEEWFMIPTLFGVHQDPIPIDKIKHEFNVRVGLYWKYGEVKTKDPLQNIINLAKGVQARKLMGSYMYTADEHIQVGLAAGVIQFRGDALTENHPSVILTPLTVVYAPVARTGHPLLKALYFRGEASYIRSTLTSDRYKGGAASASEGEWNVSAAAGFDFRRRYRH